MSKALSKNAVPSFSYKFLLPKYWLTWVGILLLSLYQYLPLFIRLRFAEKIGIWYFHKKEKRRNIALTNIGLCFPTWNKNQRENFVKQHFIWSAFIMLDAPKLWWSSKKTLQNMIKIENIEVIKEAKKKQQNIIFLTCHHLALDFGNIGLNFELPIVSLANSFRNEVIDWLISRSRTRFNTRLAARNDGVIAIKAIIKAIKEKNALYYLPDEDTGKSRTISVPFFGQKKQTLPVLGKLSKLSNATVIPCYSWYQSEKNQYVISCLPPLVFSSIKDEYQSTLQMNKTLETLINIKPEQYMWTFRLFNSLNVYDKK